MSDQPAAGMLAGRYRLLRLLASGGMGEVWLAEDEVLARPVAVKLLHADASRDEVFAQRFREEARHLARLSHPSIVAVHDFGEAEGDPYLVMEYVPGPTVAHVLRDEGPQTPEFTRRVLAQAAGALASAHASGIVHRDVKPGNILLTLEGDAKLTDFGIARIMGGAGLTRTGEVLGTPQYLSPEQTVGNAADPRSDLYALGLVGFELLTATRAFDRSTPVATALAQVNDPVPPLPDHVPTDLAEVITRCLAKSPAERPASADEVVRLLGSAGMPPSPSASRATLARAAGAAAVLEQATPAVEGSRRTLRPPGEARRGVAVAETEPAPGLDGRPAGGAGAGEWLTPVLVGALVLALLVASVFVGR